MSAILLFAGRYWRVLAIAAAVGLVLYAISSVIDRAEQRGYDSATADMAKLVAKANAATAARDADARNRIHTLETEHAQVLSTLDAERRAAAARIGPVRVQKCPAGGGKLPERAAAPALNPGPAADGGVPRGAGEAADIGPGLIELMATAKRQALDLISCQAYAREVSAGES